MKRFAERNAKVVGAVGLAVLSATVAGALEYDKIPGVSGARDYSAYFAEAAGLSAGDVVQVAGYRVGKVVDVSLDHARVLVKFNCDTSIHLGDRTEAAIKTKTLLGARALALSSRGSADLAGPIPLQRTTAPYELPTALSDLANTISGLDTGQLNHALSTLAQTFENTPTHLDAPLKGVARFSDALGRRDEQLRQLLAHANQVTGILSQRSDQIVALVHDSNALLAQLNSDSSALDSISGNVSSLARQLSGLVNDNVGLRPELDRINGVLTMLDNHKADLQKSVKLLSQYSLSLGESVSSGPFFNGYIANLLPGQLVQPFIDAAFSDLGLDPATALPSQLTDPQVGQPATPPLPVPYPRTGQGGDPRRTLPDAITGNPGDPRYPYHQPPPAPPAGGPPPGPPAGYVSGANPDHSPPLPTSVDLRPPPPGAPR